MNRLFRPVWTAGRSVRPRLSNTTKRYNSNQRPSPPPAAKEASKVSRIESRTPRFLRRYLEPLRNAPISHITAFIILHEITAIVPLFGLAAAFHYSNWLPPFISEWQWFSIGVEKFGKYLRKKGWIGDENKRGIWFGRGEVASKLVVEIATAYAITKALLPLRLIFSVWGTPWFAKLAVLPITTRMGRLFSRKKAVPPAMTSPAAGTGASAAGAVSKVTK